MPNAFAKLYPIVDQIRLKAKFKGGCGPSYEDWAQRVPE